MCEFCGDGGRQIVRKRCVYRTRELRVRELCVCVRRLYVKELRVCVCE